MSDTQVCTRCNHTFPRAHFVQKTGKTVPQVQARSSSTTAPRKLDQLHNAATAAKGLLSMRAQGTYNENRCKHCGCTNNTPGEWYWVNSACNECSACVFVSRQVQCVEVGEYSRPAVNTDKDRNRARDERRRLAKMKANNKPTAANALVEQNATTTDCFN